MEKTVIRTDAAPAPFQGAPYNQAIVAGGLVFVAGQLGLQAGRHRRRGGHRAADGAGAREPRGDPRGGRELVGQARQDQRLPHGPRRLPGDERGLREPRRRPPARPVDVPGRGAPVRRAGRDRGRRAPLDAPGEISSRPAVPTDIRRYVRSLGLDAYVVGGAVRDELLGIPHADEDFLVPGVDHAGLRAALEPHGRVEDMEVHGQLVGVRFYPRDRADPGARARGDRAHAAAEGAQRRARVIATSRSWPIRPSRSRTTWRGATSRSTPWPDASRPAS